MMSSVMWLTRSVVLMSVTLVCVTQNERYHPPTKTDDKFDISVYLEAEEIFRRGLSQSNEVKATRTPQRLELCPDATIICPCGLSVTKVRVQQCLRPGRRRGRQWCVVCNQGDACSKFEHCLNCDSDNLNGVCTDCPPGRYGELCEFEVEKLCVPSPIPWARVLHRTSQEVVYECDDGYRTADGNQQFSILCHREVTVRCEPDSSCRTSPAIPGVHLQVRLRDIKPFYDEGDEVQVECKGGFKRKHPIYFTMICRNGLWTGQSPECMPDVPCDEIPTFPGAHLKTIRSLERTPISERLQYLCINSWPQRQMMYFTIICKNGFWTGNYPDCPLVCRKFNITGGDVELSRLQHNGSEEVPVGTTAMLRCHAGFYLQGQSRVTCSEEGEWTPQIPQCIALCIQKRCKIPFPLTSNVIMEPNLSEIAVGESVRYRCHNGFFLEGPAERICMSNESLTGSNPYCTERNEGCQEFILTDGGVTFEWSEDGYVLVNSTARVYCNKGYFLQTSEVVTCSETGQWIPRLPQCLRLPDSCGIRCKIIRSLNVVVDSNSTEVSPGESVKFTCSRGSFREGPAERICLVNGSLSGSDVRCHALTTCEIPRMLHPLTYCKGNNCMEHEKSMPKPSKIELPENVISYHASLEFSCPDKYQLKGTNSVKCIGQDKFDHKFPTCHPRCGEQNPIRVPRIKSGSKTDITRWPWQAGIVYLTGNEAQLVCGAVLILQQWLLTAAHCVTRNRTVEILPSRSLRVAVGFSQRQQILSHRLRPNVLEIIIHAQYDPTTLNNDIALLRLHTPVPLSDSVGLVCLPASMPCSMHHLIPGKSGIVTGWGETNDGVLSQHLQEVNLTVAHADDCLNYFKQLGFTGYAPDIITENMFCSVSSSSTEDAAEGDSGGPFVVQVRNSWVLEGLVSWGPSTAQRISNGPQYGVFTRVARYLEWLQQKLELLPDTVSCT